MSPGKQRWGGGAKERERRDRDRQLQREGKRGGETERTILEVRKYTIVERVAIREFA